MDETIISTDKNNSVEFTTNTKGVWSFKVKAYSESIEEAFKEATRIAELTEKVCNTKNRGV